MDKTLRTVLIVLLTIVLAGGVFLGGVVFANLLSGNRSWFSTGMMGGYGGPNMMGSYGLGPLQGEKPLSEEAARNAVTNYLSRFGNADLAIKEIMVFDNNAYAAIIEKSTGIGAFELLVDPATQAVYPEYGANMMWNLKYGMMSGNSSYNGMMGGGMMGRGMMNGYSYGAQNGTVSASMPVDQSQALAAAQQYLDNYLPGDKVSEDITAFYGYYTIDTERDGKTVGMLSVNGFTKQVFYHTWHGKFISMTEK